MIGNRDEVPPYHDWQSWQRSLAELFFHILVTEPNQPTGQQPDGGLDLNPVTRSGSSDPWPRHARRMLRQPNNSIYKMAVILWITLSIWRQCGAGGRLLGAAFRYWMSSGQGNHLFPRRLEPDARIPPRTSKPENAATSSPATRPFSNPSPPASPTSRPDSITWSASHITTPFCCAESPGLPTFKPAPDASLCLAAAGGQHPRTEL